MKQVLNQRWAVILLGAALVASLATVLRPVPPRLVPYTSPFFMLGKKMIRVEMPLPEDWEADVTPDVSSDNSASLEARPVHRPTLWE